MLCQPDWHALRMARVKHSLALQDAMMELSGLEVMPTLYRLDRTTTLGVFAPLATTLPPPAFPPPPPPSPPPPVPPPRRPFTLLLHVAAEQPAERAQQAQHAS